MVSVWFFAANLIGYFRVVTGLLSFYYAYTNPALFLLLYGVSYFADALDGTAARYFNQCSQFGAVLDMVTDRVCTAGILLVLSHVDKTHSFFYTLCLILDVGSHWFQMSAAQMAHTGSHKAMGENDFFLLRLYYTSRPFLFFVCMFNEMFFGLTYLLSTMVIPEPYRTFIVVLQYGICWPVFHFKQFISLLALARACRLIVGVDQENIRKQH